MMRLILVLALVVSTACASLPAKQRAVVSLQASELALEAAHDAERAAFLSHVPGLTVSVHQRIAGAFVVAFDAQITAATALKAWRAGEPAPVSVAEYRHDLTDIMTLVSQVLPSTHATVTHAQQAIEEATKVAALIGGQSW